MKFRVRLKNNRVIGPFTNEELFKLAVQGKITHDLSFQKFPDGDWKTIEELEELQSTFDNERTVLNSDETFIFKLINIKKNEKENIEVSKLEEPSASVDPVEGASRSIIKEEVKEEKKEKVAIERLPEELDKTKINPDYQKYLEELKREAEKNRLNEEKKLKESHDVEAPDYENDKTQMIHLGELGKYLSSAVDVEIELQEEEENLEKEKQIRKKKKKEESKNIDLEEENKTPKNRIVFFLAAALLIFFVLFDDENEVSDKSKKVIYLNPEISFPQRYDVPDEKKSQNLYREGLLTLKDQTYTARLKAIKLFTSSLENKFDNNPAAAKLIFNQSDVLMNSSTKIKDSTSIFKLIQIFINKAYTDPNYASAIAYFYLNTGKYEAAIKTFDKYITLNKSKATTELFAVRLLALIEAGRIDLARSTAKKLDTVSNKDYFLILSLINYYRTEENFNKVNELVKLGQNSYPKTVVFDIEEGYLLIKQGQFKELKEIIKKIAAKKYEQSKYYYSHYLTLKGFFFASQGKTDLAEKHFTEALKNYESKRLIEKLALLEEANDEKVNVLIQNSKAKKSLRLSRDFLGKGDLKSALKWALQAKIDSPTLLAAKLFLAKLQLRRGYIADAISSLEEIYNDHALPAKSKLEVLYDLIDAYTKAFNFKKVSSLLRTVRNSEHNISYRYYKAQANYYIAKGELNLAISKLYRAINGNPIDDNNYYELAKLYIKFFQYQKAKNMLKRAMDLDPANVNYKILYAKILYEVENSDAGISYLYNVLEDFPDNPKILSEIGVYYNRSGQVKRYEQIRKMLEELPKKDKSLYQFLIESARLEDNLGKQIELSEQLLNLDPGDLKVRMDLAEKYIEKRDYKNAKVHLESVKERLDTYPRLQYLYAKLYYYVEDLDKAKELVLKEIDENPTVVAGYLLLAEIYIKENEVNKAKQQYIKAIQIDRKNIDAMFGIAYIALQNDQYDMALDQYEKVKEIDVNNQEVYRLMGDAYRKLGQSQLAIANYKQFLELSPNSKYKNKIETYIRTMQ